MPPSKAWLNHPATKILFNHGVARTDTVELETYKQFSKPDAMNNAIVAKMLAGVSTRDYQSTIDAVVDGHGISRSAVSRRGIKSAAAKAGPGF